MRVNASDTLTGIPIQLQTYFGLTRKMPSTAIGLYSFPLSIRGIFRLLILLLFILKFYPKSKFCYENESIKLRKQFITFLMIFDVEKSILISSFDIFQDFTAELNDLLPNRLAE
jgi:hypothetical protein